ncbi:MAG: hypothetical protein U1E06_19300, partial [Tabrizicola sp.]|nr:hypothetical protein [Tabrizicola sp.]
MTGLSRVDWPSALHAAVAACGDGCAAFLEAVLGDEAEAKPELVWLVLRYFGVLTADRVRKRLPALRVEAESRMRASAATARGMRAGSGEVAVGAVAPSHAGFFALDLWQVQHRRFDGGMSPLLTREVFIAGDAVTVLPYDPVRDRVL